jgi:hypothetical protein
LKTKGRSRNEPVNEPEKGPESRQPIEYSEDKRSRSEAEAGLVAFYLVDTIGAPSRMVMAQNRYYPIFDFRFLIFDFGLRTEGIAD